MLYKWTMQDMTAFKPLISTSSGKRLITVGYKLIGAPFWYV